MSRNVGNLRNLKSRILKVIDERIKNYKDLIKDYKRYVRADLKSGLFFAATMDSITLDELLERIKALEDVKREIAFIFEEIEDEEVE